MSPDEDLLLVSNLHDGVDLYNLPEVSLAKSIKHLIRHNMPKQVTFAFSGSVAVSGTDSGHVLVHDVNSGALLASLSHSVPRGT